MDDTSETIDWLLQTSDTQNQILPSKTTKKATNSNEKKPSSCLRKLFQNDPNPDFKKAPEKVLKVKTSNEVRFCLVKFALESQDWDGKKRQHSLCLLFSRILEHHPPERDCVGILVIALTREPANQVANQANKLLTFHSDMNVQRDINQFKRKIPTVLVATPGRPLDHLRTTQINGRGFGRDIMPQTPLLVLDETDIGLVEKCFKLSHLQFHTSANSQLVYSLGTTTASIVSTRRGTRSGWYSCYFSNARCLCVVLKFSRTRLL